MRGKEVNNELKAVVIDKRVGQRRPFSEITEDCQLSRTGCYQIVEHAKKRKTEQITSQGLVVTEEDKENWSTLDLIEPELLKSCDRGGRPQKLSEDEINRLIAHATANK